MSSDVKLWRYYLPNIRGEGWAIVVLGSDGFFSAVGDYGDYAYLWSHHGRNDFREFVSEIDWDYAASKLSRANEYQNNRTLRAVKDEICGMRRRQEISRGQAREAWDELSDDYAGLHSSHDFLRWLDDSAGAGLIGDACELAVRDYPWSVRAFCQKTLPRLAAVLRAELAAERSAA